VTVCVVSVLGVCAAWAAAGGGRAGAARASVCPSSPFSPARAVTGAAGRAPDSFATFRRPATSSDKLPGNGRRLSTELEGQLASYDPTLTRAATGLLVYPGGPTGSTVSTYIVVGDGAASQATLSKRCLNSIPRGRRARTERIVALDRAGTPAGPAYCFVVVSHVKTQTSGPLVAGLCDTFAHAREGYGANEIGLAFDGGPTLAGIAPDGVATVELTYRHHVPIRAAVTANTFWTRVPRVPPLVGQPHPVPPRSVLRKRVLASLALNINWLDATGHVVREFTPPADYVGFRTAIYDYCIQSNCGE
jgi:hypothetical protein